MFGKAMAESERRALHDLGRRQRVSGRRLVDNPFLMTPEQARADGLDPTPWIERREVWFDGWDEEDCLMTASAA